MEIAIVGATGLVGREILKILNQKILDKIEEFIPKGLIVSDNADSLRILNSEEAQEEEKLIKELVEFAKNSLNPDMCVEILINSQGYKKILHRKKDVLELIKNG